jgi:hypothetical protein
MVRSRVPAILLAMLLLLLIRPAPASPHPHRGYAPYAGQLRPAVPINPHHLPGVYRYASVPRWCWRRNGAAWVWLPTIDIQIGAVVAFPGWDGYWHVLERPVAGPSGITIGIELWR